MLFQKSVVVSLAFAACCAAFAQSAPGGDPANAPVQKPSGQGQPKGDIAQVKQKILANIQARIQILQNAQTCVTGAADHKALEQCRQQEHQAMESLRQQAPH